MVIVRRAVRNSLDPLTDDCGATKNAQDSNHFVYVITTIVPRNINVCGPGLRDNTYYACIGVRSWIHISI